MTLQKKWDASALEMSDKEMLVELLKNADLKEWEDQFVSVLLDKNVKLTPNQKTKLVEIYDKHFCVEE